MKLFVAPLFATAFVAGQATASPLVFEDFNAADGTALVGQPGWTQTPLGGTSNPITINGGQVALNETAGGEDATLAAGSTIGAGQTWYAGFDFAVAGGASSVNFAHFTQSSDTSFTSRLQVTGPPTAGAGFGLSIFNNTVGDAQKWANNLQYDTTYRVVVAYEFDSGVSRFWIDPTTLGDPSVTTFVATDSDPSHAIDSFGLRQSNDGSSTVTIDNLSLATDFNSALIPEPGSLALLSLAGLALIRRRRA